MSARGDRIPVPSNGHRPPDPAAADSAAPDPAAAGPAAPGPAVVAPATPFDDERAEPPRIIVTPGQATIAGFGIIAGLILVLLGRRRGRRD